ncbi:putative ABC transporter permease [Eubacteriales bacterium OttesenSCG-928-K08]|nr:putative ABC transporter permease [Eubacteriales bacterium OttesenSCG-928-K08]
MKKISTVELILLFTIGSIIGFIVETIFCLFKNGRFESRKGLVYGPFSQVYGFGAVLLTITLSRLADRGFLTLFVASAILGGVYEALCSFWQEKTFGTVSWEYSKKSIPLFGGRTCLFYMLFWGVMGAVYIRLIHPVLFGLIRGVSPLISTPVAVLLALFLFYDLSLSMLAVDRWQNRVRGVAPAQKLDEWLDRRFPNERMKRIYPNMVTVNSVAKPNSAKKAVYGEGA